MKVMFYKRHDGISNQENQKGVLEVMIMGIERKKKIE
jgi:hypothetical protein